MMLLDPRLWLALLIALAGAYGTGRWQQWRSDEKAQVAATLKAAQQARETETNWNIAVQAQEEIHAEEIARINAARLAAERRLLNRPSRLSAPAAPASQSGTGANLFREDGQFLRGESARADELRAALDRCQVWIDKVTK